MTDNNINLKNQINNAMKGIVESNEAVKLLVDSICANSSVSIYKAVVCIIKEMSPEKAIDITAKMIVNGIYPEKMVFTLIDLIEEYSYTLGNSCEQFDAFTKAINHVIAGHNSYSADTLVSLAELLERLFAKGYTKIREYIVNLYRVIPNSLSYSKDFKLHRELIEVYSYNGYNYTVLYDKLTQIYEKCRMSRAKHLYGEIFYYFAVLDLLSGHKTYYNDMPYLYRSCERGYELAEELERSFSDNRGGFYYE